MFPIVSLVPLLILLSVKSSGIETPSDVAVKSDTSDWNFSFKNITELPWEKLLDLILKCISIFGSYFSKEAPPAPQIIFNGPVNGPVFVFYGPINDPVFIGQNYHPYLQATKSYSTDTCSPEPETVTKTEAVFPGHTSVANPLRTTTIQPTVTKRADL